VATLVLFVRSRLVQDDPNGTCVLYTAANLSMIICTLGHPGRLLALDMPTDDLWTPEIARRTRRQGIALLGVVIVVAGIWGFLE
jgi:hypothetical protein